MRNAMTMLIGILVVIGVVFGPRLSEGAISSCSVSGNYKMSGFALGDTEVFGSLDYTPNGPCTGGTFTGSVTVKVGGNPSILFVPTGTYVVNADSSMTITNTGGVTVTLTGNVSQVVNDIANAIHVAGDVGGAINVGLTMTRGALTSATLLTGGSFGLDLSFPGGTLHRCGPGNGCNPTGTVGGDIAVPVSAGTVRNLRANVQPAPGIGQSLTFVVEKTGLDTPITCSISGGSTACSDTTNSASFSDGDLLAVRVIPSSSTTPAMAVRYSLTHQP
ncbi:MAG: hypothetical protein HYY12_04655 [Candidatus Methylomirabilis oxyfera]|nr:hypothetical protein [Candidatus Methylomirabilis oxyfera]